MMTNPQYQKLQAVCEALDSLCGRLDRRQNKHACHADDFADGRIRKVIFPVLETTRTYRDFHKLFANDRGRVNHEYREQFFDLLVIADAARQKLKTLTEDTLGAKPSVPGLNGRLSPLFKATLEGQKNEVARLQQQMQAIIQSDIQTLKLMPRHLRLVPLSLEG